MIQANLSTEPAATLQVETLMQGTISVPATRIIHFVQPLIGIGHLRDFVILSTDGGPLFWLQSIHDRSSCFCLLAPFRAGLDLDIVVGRDDLRDLGASGPEAVSVYSLVVLDADPARIRTNLRAPILCCDTTCKAKQLVIDDPKLPVQFYLKDLARQQLVPARA